jgi:hypothetical protein
MVETDGADQFELEDLDGSPHAFAHGSSITYSYGGCVDSLTVDDHDGQPSLTPSFAPTMDLGVLATNKHILDWDESDVHEWFRSLGYPQYEAQIKGTPNLKSIYIYPASNL